MVTLAPTANGSSSSSSSSCDIIVGGDGKETSVSGGGLDAIKNSSGPLDDEEREHSSDGVICSSQADGPNDDNGSTNNGDNKVRVIHDSDNIRIARSPKDDDVVIKTLADGETDASRLHNEYAALSNPKLESLIERGVIRGAVEKKQVRAGAAGLELHLEYVDGVTLKEWSSSHGQRRTEATLKKQINNARSSSSKGTDETKTDESTAPDNDAGDDDDDDGGDDDGVRRSLLLDIVKMMHRVASAVSRIHSAGYMHNGISTENILVCKEEEEENHRCKHVDQNVGEDDVPNVTIIDFGDAQLRSLIETDDTGDVANDDLYGLGVVFADLLVPYSSASPDSKCSNDAAKGNHGSGNRSFDRYNSGFSGCSSTTADSLFGSAPTIPLPEGAVPKSLRTMVSNLGVQIDPPLPNPAKDDDAYRNVHDVAEDLAQMVEDPARFLFDDDDDDGSDISSPQSRAPQAQCRRRRLDLDATKLHGHEESISTLIQAYHDRIRFAAQNVDKDEEQRRKRRDGRRSTRRGSGLILPPAPPPGLLLVSGPPGAGKTTVVEHVFRRDRDGGEDGSDGGEGRATTVGSKHWYASGRFAPLGNGAPYATLSTVFADLCHQIITSSSPSEGNGVELEVVKRRVRDAIGDEGRYISDLVPNLDELLGEDFSTSFSSLRSGFSSVAGGDEVAAMDKVTGKEARNRFDFLVRGFVRALSRPDRPVVLFLDDLQWADESSLTLIKTISSDPDNASVLVVGCYRDDAIGEEQEVDHPLLKLCPSVQEEDEEDHADASIKRIRVGNLGRNDLNAWISDSIRTYRRLTKPLADVVYRKTHGNAFFVQDFVKTLHEEDLLCFNVASDRWVWNEAEIRSKNVVGSVVGLLSDRLRSLPLEAQEALKVASCIGSQFNSSHLKLVVEDGRKSDQQGGCQYSVSQILGLVVTEGLLDQLGNRETDSIYKFAHNRVQQAAYSLLTEEERSALHVRIGSVLLRHASSRQLKNEELFLIVDQLNLGSRSIVDRAKKTELALLNLRAGEKAVVSSAFVTAETYLGAGVDALDGAHWEENYELSLSLYSSLAETRYSTGNFDEIDGVLEKIFSNALTFLDKFRAYSTLIKLLGARQRPKEAIETCIDVLEQLGEPFPKQPKTAAIMKDLFKTKFALRGLTDKNILALPLMEDEAKIAAMEVLNSMLFSAMLGGRTYVPLIVFRMVRLTLRHGVNRMSAYGFAMYGRMLCGQFGNLKGGYRFGRLALLLLERLKAHEWHALVSAFVYIFINHWFEPLEHSIEPLLYSYRAGMETGDVEFAMMSAQAYCNFSFQCGHPLAALEAEMRTYCQKMAEYNQEMTLNAGLPLWQTILNLLGRSTDPLQLTGDAMDQDGMLQKVRSEGNVNQECAIYISIMKLAYIFGEIGLATEMAEKSRKLLRLKFTFELCSYSFYAGLISIAMARKTQQKKWRVLAKKQIKTVKKWEKNAPANCRQKIHLMEAELSALNGKADRARKSYDAAIMFARKHGYVQDEALAYERASIFYQEAGDNSTACRYCARAHQNYVIWGALAKADRLKLQKSSLIGSGTRRESFKSFLKEASRSHPQAA